MLFGKIAMKLQNIFWKTKQGETVNHKYATNFSDCNALSDLRIKS